MANKNKGGRESRKPKKDAKAKPITSIVRPVSAAPASTAKAKGD